MNKKLLFLFLLPFINDLLITYLNATLCMAFQGISYRGLISECDHFICYEFQIGGWMERILHL